MSGTQRLMLSSPRRDASFSQPGYSMSWRSDHFFSQPTGRCDLVRRKYWTRSTTFVRGSINECLRCGLKDRCLLTENGHGSATG